jgi:hypothetical protein
VQLLPAGPRIPDPPCVHGKLLVAGAVMLALKLAWPKWFYPCVWISLMCLFEPVNDGWGDGICPKPDRIFLTIMG